MLTQPAFRRQQGNDEFTALVPPDNSFKMVFAPILRKFTGFRPFDSHITLTDSAHHASRLRLKTIPLILLSITLGPMGNVLLGRGMKGVGPVRAASLQDFLSIVQRTFSSGYLWMGVACLLAFFLVHMLLLTWADYSYVQPATALAYASVAVLSHFVLHEVISPLRWAGVATICLGVLIVGRTHPNTTGVE